VFALDLFHVELNFVTVLPNILNFLEQKIAFFDQIGSVLVYIMDQNGSNLIKLDFSPGRTRPFLSPRHGSGHRGHRRHRSETVKNNKNHLKNRQITVVKKYLRVTNNQPHWVLTSIPDFE
jgi:hypothetical protein